MAWTKTYTGEEPLRINKWLAQEGVCSRREADALIEKGLIQLDGKPVTVAGERVTKGQTLSLTDAASRRLDNQLSVILNKPVGFVSGTPEPGETPAIRLVTSENLSGSAHAIPQRSNKMAPLGRLDKDSRGLLILSEDGVLAKAIIGPLSDMDKEYLVKVRGDITPAKVALLRHGLELDGRQLRPAEVQQERNNTLRFVLKEGRNRQIRRMCDLVELRVLDLQRIRVGPILLAGLPEGKWRPLGAKERATLLAVGAGEEVRSRPVRQEDRARPSDAPRRDKPRIVRDRLGQTGPKSGQPRSEKQRTGPKSARPDTKPPADTSEPGSNRHSALKGDKFKRTKLPPRERKPIK